MPSYSRKAGGTIATYTFVMMDTTTEGQVVQATAGAEIYGVSQAGTRRVPYDGLDDGNAAIAGEDINVFGPPEVGIMLRAGGTVVRGDRLKADATGRGITTVTATDEVGAIAQGSGAVDDLIPVQLIGPMKL